MSFYRKYRPQLFSEVFGQEHVVTTLKNALIRDQVVHAYLFTGPRGTGKTTLARLLAKAVNCLDLQKDGEPCDKCARCLEFAENKMMDLIEMDAASHTGVEEVRDLIEKAQFTPSIAKKKVYIIDEVHMLSKSAFNALLKTLEEPPSHVHFILATTEIDKVPETILSRCQRFDFKRIEIDHIVAKLEKIAKKEKVKADKKALELIAKHSLGGMRNAEVSLEQMAQQGDLTYEKVKQNLGLTDEIIVEEFLAMLENKDIKGALERIHSVYVEGRDLLQFRQSFIELLRENINKAILANNLADAMRYAKMINIILENAENMRNSFIPELPLEIAAIEICEQSASPVKVKEQKLIAAEVAPAPTPKKAVSDVSSIDEGFKKLWVEVLNCQKLSSIYRSCLRNAIPTKLEGDKLELCFSANFHLDRVNKATVKILIEETISEIFGKPIYLSFNLKDHQKGKTPEEEETITADKLADMLDGKVIE